MQNIKKNPQNPRHREKKTDKHSYSNCYSLTIRTGNGFNLGSESVSHITEYIKNISVFHVLAIEMDGDAEHLQGGFYCETDCRQDIIRDKLNKWTIDIYKFNATIKEQLPTTKHLENVKKRACLLKAHHDYDILVNYCLKDPMRIISTKLSNSQITHFYCTPHHNFKCFKCKPYIHYPKYYDDSHIIPNLIKF